LEEHPPGWACPYAPAPAMAECHAAELPSHNNAPHLIAPQRPGSNLVLRVLSMGSR
jgi:hypothetical protein